MFINKKQQTSDRTESFKKEFEKLASSSYNRLYRSALFFTGNAEDAADLVQETFYTALKKFEDYRGDSKFFTWLYGIFRNLLKKHRRSRKTYINRFGSLEEDNAAEELLKTRDTPETLLFRKENINRIFEAFKKIPEKYEEVLVLRHFEGFSYEEISKITGCRRGTVKSRIHNARKLLRKYME